MIGKKLKVLLKQTGKRQIDLARHLGISASRLSNYLSDKREPDFQMLSEMAYFLGVDLNYFSNKNFKKKRKDDIFEIAEDVMFMAAKEKALLKLPFHLLMAKRKVLPQTLFLLVVFSF